MPHDSLSIGDKAPEIVNMLVEVQSGSANKYEWDAQSGLLKLDRVLHGALHYPGDYGFIPETLADDGDPLDGVVLSSYPLLPGTLVEIRVLAVLEMEDEKGEDAKILAVVDKDPRLNDYRSLGDVPQSILKEIAHFFETYKQLEPNKWAKVRGWQDAAAAHATIQAAHRTFEVQNSNPTRG